MCKDGELGQDVAFDFTKHVDMSADAIKAIQVHTLTETLGAFKTSLNIFEDVMVWKNKKQDEAHEPECRHVCWGTDTILISHIFQRTHLRDTLSWHTEVTLL